MSETKWFFWRAGFFPANQELFESF